MFCRQIYGYSCKPQRLFEEKISLLKQIRNKMPYIVLLVMSGSAGDEWVGLFCLSWQAWCLGCAVTMFSRSKHGDSHLCPWPCCHYLHDDVSFSLSLSHVICAQGCKSKFQNNPFFLVILRKNGMRYLIRWKGEFYVGHSSRPHPCLSLSFPLGSPTLGNGNRTDTKGGHVVLIGVNFFYAV